MGPLKVRFRQLDESMEPTWTGKHTFQDDVQFDQNITGSINIVDVDPEVRVTDTTSNEYSRRVKMASGNRMSIFNRIQKPSVSSGALDFAANNAGVSIPYNNIGTSITFAFWFKTRSTSPQALICFMSTRLYINPGSSIVHWDPNWNTGPEEFSYIIQSDTWYRLVVTHTGPDNSAVGKVYVNGVLISGALAYGKAINTANGGANSVGIRGDDLSLDFDGVIDEVCIFSEVKDQDWVTADYNSGYGRYTPNTDANAEYIYHFDDGSGTTPDDSSGNSRDGTFIGTPTWVTGKVTPESTMFETEVVRSEDGIMQGEAGIQTFGDPAGRTVVTGLRVQVVSADGVVNLPVLDTDPTSPQDGDVWLYENGSTREIRVQMSGTTRAVALTG